MLKFSWEGRVGEELGEEGTGQFRHALVSLAEDCHLCSQRIKML